MPKTAKISSLKTQNKTLPDNFYERVLDYERQIESLKDRCPESLIQGLTNLYGQAIEYHAFKDNQQKCLELQMRMQSILVRPYVLDCLSKFENEKRQRLSRAAD